MSNPESCRTGWVNRLLIAVLVVVASTASAIAPLTAQSVEPTFLVETGVSTQDADFVQEGIILAEEFFTAQLGAALSSALQVELKATPDERAPDLLAYWNGSTIVVLTGSPVWEELIPVERIATIVHEFTHVYQTDVLGFDNLESPAWFEEGVAEYLSYALLGQMGLLDHQDLIALDTTIVSRHLQGVTLNAVSDWRDFQEMDAEVYALSHAAVAHLMEDLPLSVIGLYYSMLSRGLPIDEVFMALFSTTPDAFSEEMSRYLSSWDGVGGRAISADHVDQPIVQPHPVQVTGAPATVEEGTQFLVTGLTVPATVCTLAMFGAGSQIPIVQRSTFADGTGDLFWLVTIPPGDQTGLVTMEISCGAEPQSRVAILSP